MSLRYLAFIVLAAFGCAETATEVPQALPASPEEPAVELRTDNVSQVGPSQQAALVEADYTDENAAPIHGGFDNPVNVGLLPEVIPPHRDRKRMDIDQLNASILAATGGVGWVVNDREQFDELARTLGKPDYFDLTSEDLEPAALFQKFLDDAARHVCYALVEKELEAAPAERVLMVHAGPEDTLAAAPEKIEENLSYLLLRYHGRHVETGGPGMQSFRWLYQSAEHITQDPVLAWRTVCVGLMVHPEFYSY